MNKFVFVVCGSREHIDTLHFSLPYLRHFSKNEIIVVTDSRRNEIPVVWDNVVDIKTPENFTNHQASIYLKVGLNKFLPAGHHYCYLDTDVIALSAECDKIFNYQKGPVTFAADHCRLPAFSPSAVKCHCAEQNKKDMQELEMLMERYDPARKLVDPSLEHKKRALIQKFELLKQQKISYFFLALRFIATWKRFKLDDDTFYDRKRKLWIDAEGRVIISPSENMFKEIEKNSRWRWNRLTRRWYDEQGRDVYHLTCNHLAEHIFSKFGVVVKDKNFQHWNGGVFLFDDSSKEFLTTWFNYTMKIFDDEQWYTRDQGTLIATVWKLGLQNNPLLPQRFNFIADYTNPKLMMDAHGVFSDNASKTTVQPAFIHIYHNFGMKGWDIWDYVERLGEKIGIRHERA